MNIFSSLSGLVTVSVMGANLPKTLGSLAGHGIHIQNCQFVTELEANITIRRADFRQVKQICQKRGDVLQMKKRSGIYWRLKGLKSRPVLVTGMLLYFLLALYLPSRVLFVQVVGNQNVPTRLILEAAAECGIGFGASRRSVRSEKMKNALLEAIPQLQWAGVNSYGCVAEISVRERPSQDSADSKPAVGHIVACREGIVTSCNATRGSLLCEPGQAVASGDVLISGYTDCGLTIRAEQAEGEVFAATKHDIHVITPIFGLDAVQTDDEMKKISLLIGKKRIFFWKDSGFWDTTCDRMYEENYITLPGGFRLPVGWCVERYRVRTCSEGTITSARLEQLLQETGEGYLKKQMLAGTIRTSDLFFEEGDGVMHMTGEYGCVEMIGIFRRLEMGETNGESN